MPPIVVWLKRDLRLHDHPALTAAAERGPVLLLYVIEPALWTQPDAARQHYEFTRESVEALQASAHKRGGGVCVRQGDILEVLSQLRAETGFEQLISHEETGNDWSYARDRAVAHWCRAMGLNWQELPQCTVVRRLRSRDDWQAHRERFLSQTALPVPALTWHQPLPVSSPWPAWQDLAPTASLWQPPERQQGGRPRAVQRLQEFLEGGGQHYRSGMSSPLSAQDACSRLSPYIAWGCLSVREVLQACERRATALPPAGRQRQGLHSFAKRLHWRDHFMQKLEDEPALEWRNLHRGYDGLREPDWQAEHFERLREGRTGWPLVDACVALLHHTGWLNFRMRAMLISVASYPLWLHWREPGLWLAREFLDYEPGIHWPQVQMQAGTTGINTTRVYNPIKQAQDQDPQGHFVRQWLPALRLVPDTWLAEPWRMPAALQLRHGLQPGVDLPVPPVDLSEALKRAKARMHAHRQAPEVRAGVAAVVERHASRQGRRDALPRRRREAGPTDEPAQQNLLF